MQRNYYCMVVVKDVHNVLNILSFCCFVIVIIIFKLAIYIKYKMNCVFVAYPQGYVPSK